MSLLKETVSEIVTKVVIKILTIAMLFALDDARGTDLVLVLLLVVSQLRVKPMQSIVILLDAIVLVLLALRAIPEESMQSIVGATKSLLGVQNVD